MPSSKRRRSSIASLPSPSHVSVSASPKKKKRKRQRRKPKKISDPEQNQVHGIGPTFDHDATETVNTNNKSSILSETRAGLFILINLLST
jgi:hypothetical protein